MAWQFMWRRASNFNGLKTSGDADGCKKSKILRRPIRIPNKLSLQWHCFQQKFSHQIQSMGAKILDIF